MANEKTYGTIAQFRHPGPLLSAAQAARKAGYLKLEAYSPFPVPELVETLHIPNDHVAMATLIGGVTSGLLGFLMQWYANVIDYPINIGGRPDNSWPSFIPITFELTVLGASLSAALGMLIMNRLPRLSHPIFSAKGFEQVSTGAFILCIRADDLKYRAEGSENVSRFLRALDADAVTEVPNP